jgi:hypothetical protein
MPSTAGLIKHLELAREYLELKLPNGRRKRKG